MSFGHMFFTKNPCDFLLKSRYFRFEETASVCNLYTCFSFDETIGLVDITVLCPNSQSYHYFLTKDGVSFLEEIRQKYPEGIYAYVLLKHRQGEDDFAKSKALMLKNENRLPLLDLKKGTTITLNQPYRLCDTHTVNEMRFSKKTDKVPKKHKTKRYSKASQCFYSGMLICS